MSAKAFQKVGFMFRCIVGGNKGDRLWAREFLLAKKGLEEPQLVPFNEGPNSGGQIAEVKLQELAESAAKAIFEAEQLAESIKESARKEAAGIIRQTEERARQIIGEAERAAALCGRELTKLDSGQTEGEQAEPIPAEIAIRQEVSQQTTDIQSALDASDSQAHQEILAGPESLENDSGRGTSGEEQPPPEIHPAVETTEEPVEVLVHAKAMAGREPAPQAVHPGEDVSEEVASPIGERDPAPPQADTDAPLPDFKLHKGEIELVIPSPQKDDDASDHLAKLGDLHTKLRETPGASISSTIGTATEGHRIVVHFEEPVSLAEVLSDVARWEEIVPTRSRSLMSRARFGKASDDPQGKRIVVAL